MAYSERLASRIRNILGVDERKMFGGLAFMVREHMCCGVIRDDVMLRFGADRAKDALRERHVRPMDFTGRPMNGYVFVSAPGVKTDAKLAPWLRLAREFIETLPP